MRAIIPSYLSIARRSWYPLLEAKFSLSTFSTCWALCRSSMGDVVPSCLSLLSLLLFHPCFRGCTSLTQCHSLLMEREGEKERGCLHGRELLRAALGELSVKCSSCCCFSFDSERVSEEGSAKGDFILSSLPNYPSTATSLHIPGQCSLSLSAAPHSLGTDRHCGVPARVSPSLSLCEGASCSSGNLWSVISPSHTVSVCRLPETQPQINKNEAVLCHEIFVTAEVSCREAVVAGNSPWCWWPGTEPGGSASLFDRLTEKNETEKWAVRLQTGWGLAIASCAGMCYWSWRAESQGSSWRRGHSGMDPCQGSSAVSSQRDRHQCQGKALRGLHWLKWLLPAVTWGCSTPTPLSSSP